MPYEEVLEHRNEGNYDKLLLKDELRILQKKNGTLNISFPRALSFVLDEPYTEFKEGAIDFAPTYKFDLNSNGDTYAKHRTPSYTVRIRTENRKDKNIEFERKLLSKFLFSINNRFDKMEYQDAT